MGLEETEKEMYLNKGLGLLLVLISGFFKGFSFFPFIRLK